MHTHLGNLSLQSVIKAAATRAASQRAAADKAPRGAAGVAPLAAALVARQAAAAKPAPAPAVVTTAKPLTAIAPAAAVAAALASAVPATAGAAAARAVAMSAQVKAARAPADAARDALRELLARADQIGLTAALERFRTPAGDAARRWHRSVEYQPLLSRAAAANRVDAVRAEIVARQDADLAAARAYAQQAASDAAYREMIAPALAASSRLQSEKWALVFQEAALVKLRALAAAVGPDQAKYAAALARVEPLVQARRESVAALQQQETAAWTAARTADARAEADYQRARSDTEARLANAENVAIAAQNWLDAVMRTDASTAVRQQVEQINAAGGEAYRTASGEVVVVKPPPSSSGGTSSSGSGTGSSSGSGSGASSGAGTSAGSGSSGGGATSGTTPTTTAPTGSVTTTAAPTGGAGEDSAAEAPASSLMKFAPWALAGVGAYLLFGRKSKSSGAGRGAKV